MPLLLIFKFHDNSVMWTVPLTAWSLFGKSMWVVFRVLKQQLHSLPQKAQSSIVGDERKFLRETSEFLICKNFSFAIFKNRNQVSKRSLAPLQKTLFKPSVQMGLREPVTCRLQGCGNDIKPSVTQADNYLHIKTSVLEIS